MSRTTAWVAAAYTTIAMLVISFAGVAIAVPASAAAEAPPPVQYDRPCALHDEYFIPLSGSMYYVNDVYQAPGYHAVVGTTVTIRPSAGFSGGPWTFDYTNNAEPCPAEAVNSMTVQVGVCKPVPGLTDVTASYKNEPDASTFPQENVITTTRWVVLDPDDYMVNNSVIRLNDGESVTLGLGSSGDGSLQGTGLEPGTYELQGWHMGSAGKVTTRFFVPSCGSRIPPPGDPSGLGPSIDGIPPDGPETSSTQATGKLKLLRRVKLLKVQAINRKVESRTTFKLKRPGIRKPIIIKAPANKVIVKRVKAVKPGKYVLRARVTVNGQLRYKPVAKLVVKR